MTKRRLQELLGRLEPRMARRYRQVVQRVKSRRTLAQLEDALSSGGGAVGVLLDDMDAAAAAVAARGAAAHQTVAGEVAATLSTQLDKLVSYDGTNPRAVAALARNRLALISHITDDQRQAIGEALRQGLEGGWSPRKTATLIRESIGLTPKQVATAANYRRSLELLDRRALEYKLRDARGDKAVLGAIQRGVPLTEKQIDKMVARYTAGQLRLRSEMIARTETLRAIHEAQDEAYQQAIDAGHLDVDRLQCRWHAGAAPRTRNWHASMDGQLRRHGVPFRSGYGNELLYPCEVGAPASEVVSCRCAKSVRVLPVGQVAVNSDGGTKPSATGAPAAPRSETVTDAPAVAPGRLATSTLDREGLAKAFPRGGAFGEAQQKALRAHLTGVVAGYGLHFADGARALRHTVNVESVETMGFSGGYHGWDGEIVVSDDQFELLAGFNAESAAGTDFGGEFLDATTAPERIAELHNQADTYRMFVHEAVHGHGPDISDAFVGAGMAAEEAITEVVARRMTRDALGLDLETISTWGPDGPNYAEFVTPMRDAIGTVLSLDSAAAYRKLEDAALAFKRLRVRLATPEAAVERFVDGIDLALYDGPVQAQIRKSLRDYFLAVWPTPPAA